MQKPVLKEFKPKTPAKAEEVNYNFDQMNGYVSGTADELKTLVNSAIANINLQLSQYLVTGMLLPYDGDVENIPNGWLLCDGRAVSRETYKNLYNKIGTKHGAGDGVTTFNLPNYIGRVIEGATEAGIVKEAGLPDHRHLVVYNQIETYNNLTPDNSVTMGGYSGSSDYKYTLMGSVNNKEANMGRTTLASKFNDIYGKSNTVQAPAVTALILIKT